MTLGCLTSDLLGLGRYFPSRNLGLFFQETSFQQPRLIPTSEIYTRALNKDLRKALCRRKLESMAFPKPALLLVAFAVAHFAVSQQPVAVQRTPQQNGMPSSGGYEPPSSSMTRLLESDHAMNEALMTFARTGDRTAYKTAVFKAAQEGDLAAEILLAEQYIPEQCTFEPNQDVPHCGKTGNEPPHVVFRTNPLDIEVSYEEASKWLEMASAHGSGEASEVLAQLITRMQANHHGTHYTTEDSTHFHALARSQGFDVEAISVTCYKRVPGGSGITLDRLPGLIVGEQPNEPFTPEELEALNKAGIAGALLYGGSSGGGDSVLLMRPQGPTVNVRIILDHDPDSEVLLPMPAHHDEIYAQRGDEFLAFPNGGDIMPRFINLEPQTQNTPQVSVSTQTMDGGHSGGFCTRF